MGSARLWTGGTWPRSCGWKCTHPPVGRNQPSCLSWASRAAPDQPTCAGPASPGAASAATDSTATTRPRSVVRGPWSMVHGPWSVARGPQDGLLASRCAEMHPVSRHWNRASVVAAPMLAPDQQRCFSKIRTQLRTGRNWVHFCTRVQSTARGAHSLSRLIDRNSQNLSGSIRQPTPAPVMPPPGPALATHATPLRHRPCRLRQHPRGHQHRHHRRHPRGHQHRRHGLHRCWHGRTDAGTAAPTPTGPRSRARCPPRPPRPWSGRRRSG